MKSREHWQQYFKLETQAAGDDLVAKRDVTLTVTSDTAITGFVRGGGNSKVTFVSRSIADATFTASCTCSRANKGVFCKHIWAVLCLTDEKHPDFLDSKSHLDLVVVGTPAKTSAFKEKQLEYKKLQTERVKTRNKEIRQIQKSMKKNSADPRPSKFTVSYPEEVQRALDFFRLNGFPLMENLNEEDLKEARKVLARVFHPDRGGTHEESLLLNKHYDALMEYLGS